MVTTKRICKVHKVVINKKLVPCEARVIKKDSEYIEFCPKCRKEGTNYGIKTALFTEWKL